MPKVVVVSGANGLELGVSVAKAINGEFIMIEQKIFPDGELYIRLSDPTRMRDSIAIIVNTLFPEQNKSWIETLLLIDSVKEAGAEHVIGVIPYIAYSRQDKVFLPGEPVSIRALLKALKVSGMDYLLTVDIHNPVSLKEFGDHAKNVMISDLLAKEALKYTKTPLVLAPDKGALERARVAAEAIGAEFDYLIKYRDKTTGEVKLEPKEISVKNKDVIIPEDTTWLSLFLSSLYSATYFMIAAGIPNAPNSITIP